MIREEKLVTAFELIGIYCELIVARLPIIESQKYVDRSSNNILRILFLLVS